MDTPERSKTTAALSKVEDSPVFSFLNSLSPIKPVKSVHITQTFNSLSFGSPPSVFTSPQNPLKESRFLRRNHLCDASKSEFVDKDDATEGVVGVAPICTENRETLNSGDTVKASVEQSYECSKLAADISSYDLHSLDSIQTPSSGRKRKLMSETDGTSGVHVPYFQELYNSVFQGTEANMERIRQIDQNKEAIECDWQLIHDAADMFNFSSLDRTEALKSMDETRFYTTVSHDAQNPQTFADLGSGDRLAEGGELGNQLTQCETGNKPKEASETQDAMGMSFRGISYMAAAPVDTVDPQVVSNLYRGMRRRSLVFDLSGGRRKRLDESSTSDSTTSAESDGLLATYRDKPLVPANIGNESSRCAVAGIGLHLNALTRTSIDCKVVKKEILGSGTELLTPPVSVTNNRWLNTGLDSLSKLVNMTQLDREVSLIGNGMQLLEDSGKVSGHMVSEENIQNKPKKKRSSSEDGEAGACKRCNCKKSKCLKLYCECFAAGVYCVEPCSCLDCFNKPIHEDTVLATRKQIESRNPLAFAPKVIRISDALPESGEESNKTPASARHKRGCNCKKSGCLKKYCECYQGGVGCSVNCRCEGCKNAFGRKDGSEAEPEEEEEEEETDTSERSVADRNHQRTVIPGDAELNPDYIHPATPLGFGRPSLQLVFPLNYKPPRSTFLPLGSSSALCASQGLGKPSLVPPSKYKNDFGTVQEDEMPELLQTNSSPNSAVKSASPNRKRVSPPHIGRRMLSGQSSSRKLILQSIPTFPSLSPKR